MPGNISRATSTTYKTPPPERKSWWWFAGLSDLLNLICLLVASGFAIWSVQQARWVRPSPSFVTIFVLAVITGFILAKSRLPSLVAHILAMLTGAIIVFWQGLMLVSNPDWISRTISFTSSMQAWWHDQINGIPSTGTLHVALIFGLLTWIIGYLSIWPLVKKHNPWIAVLLGTIVMLINLNFWTSDKYYYFLIFLVAALVLIAVATYTKNKIHLTKVDYSGFNWGPKLWAAASICLIVIASYFTWISPGFRVAAISGYAKAHSPFKGSFETFWQNFFATVPGSGAPVLMHGGQQELQLGGSLKLSDQVDFIIDTDYKTYWETQIYDYYNSNDWKASAVDSTVIENGTSSGKTGTSSGDRLSYTLIPQVNTNVIPTAGDFVSGSIPIIEKTLSPMVFDINLVNSSGDASLPQDIASLAKKIRAAHLTGRRFDQQLEALLPSGIRLVSINRSGFTVQSISVTRTQPENKDEIALTSAKIIEHQKEANITVEIPPKVTTDELESAGIKYPVQITDRYLQLPESLPDRVKELAINITKGYDNPYQKAQAIKDHLASYQYSLTIEAPPENTDGVDYFLFTQKSGYCTYFASAMTVMLRSAGVPARMVVGFLPGQYDSESHSYVIRDRDYHAWTEVYFPGYGWITFDPTPSGATPESTGNATDILPSNPDYPSQDNSQATSAGNPSPEINYGRYVSLGVGALAGIFILLIIVFCVWLYSRPRNSYVIYSRMVMLASLAGLGPKRWQTALEFSNRLAIALPRNASNIDIITKAYVFNCYGNRPLVNSSGENLRKSWAELRSALFRRLLRIK